jgi:hypothetical protein
MIFAILIWQYILLRLHKQNQFISKFHVLSKRLMAQRVMVLRFQDNQVALRFITFLKQLMEQYY